MNKTFANILKGYQAFQARYHDGDQSVMKMLATDGQKPEIMVVACCDSRVDPAILLQCHPGDIFVVRNVANIIPPYENDEYHHGTSAALEFAVCYLGIKHLIILGHSQCGGLNALIHQDSLVQNDFISRWVSLAHPESDVTACEDDLAKISLNNSYHNCLTFPWIQQKVADNSLHIHRWFFNIKEAEIFAFSETTKQYAPLSEAPFR